MDAMTPPRPPGHGHASGHPFDHAFGHPWPGARPGPVPPGPGPAAAPGAAGSWVRPAHRDTGAPVLGGVAAGLADHMAWPVLWVRAGFIALAVMGGFGLLLYGGLWIFLPADPGLRAQAPGLESGARLGTRASRGSRLADAGPALVLGVLAIGVLAAVQGIFGIGALMWPVLVALAGLALIWRQADASQRARMDDLSGRTPLRTVFGDGGFAAYARVAAGAVLLFGALLMFVLRNGTSQVAGDVVLATALGVLGLALVVGPWVLRLWNDLGSERAERIRSQERADMAAHLHDSVLQTLALIQKNAHDPAMVSRLARAQERDLRTWLFEEPTTGDQVTLAAALRDTAGRVEGEYDVKVDVVVVGDTFVDEALQPLVAAAAESVVNAAKHAGVDRIDVYAEVIGEETVEVFVRDRGAGFDPDRVPPDRQGVRSSVVGRMERHGGTARVRSAPGEGTEVRLTMPVSRATEQRTHEEQEERG